MNPLTGLATGDLEVFGGVLFSYSRRGALHGVEVFFGDTPTGGYRAAITGVGQITDDRVKEIHRRWFATDQL